MVQSYTAGTCLLAATNAFGLGEDARVLLNRIIYTVSIPCTQQYVTSQLSTHHWMEDKTIAPQHARCHLIISTATEVTTIWWNRICISSSLLHCITSTHADIRVVRSVSVLGKLVSCAKMAEPVETPFQRNLYGMGQRNHYHTGPDPPMKKEKEEFCLGQNGYRVYRQDTITKVGGVQQ